MRLTFSGTNRYKQKALFLPPVTNSNSIRNMIKNICLCFFAALFFSSCSSGNKKKDATSRNFSFSTVKGIKYEEVKRRFSNGLSFNKDGFMQEPSWIVQFLSDDSVLAYSPQKKIMQGFHLHYDHGAVYNFAEEWFRVKHISKDSLVLQRLEVNSMKIANDIRSDVNMTFYAQSYIKNKLKTTAQLLQRPTKSDTLFIKKLSVKANRNATIKDSVYAARNPVVFTPLAQSVSVKKISAINKLEQRTAAYDYMYPEYEITIRNAYKDFNYECMAIVDTDGKFHVTKIQGILPEDHENKKKVIDAILQLYVQNLFKIVPGATLGILHASEINLSIIGKRK